MDPMEEVVRNLFRLQRLSNGLSKAARDEIRKLTDEMLGIIARNDPTSVQSRYVAGRLAKIRAATAAASRDAFVVIEREYRATLSGIGRSQADWAAGQLIGTVATAGGTVNVSARGMGVNFFKAILDTDPFEGRTLKEWLKIGSENVERRLTRQVQLGMTQGETLDQIVRRIRGRSVGGGRFRGGVVGATVRDAETIARTSVNYIANRAHMELYREHDDVTMKYRYLATLDGRTSDICRALDGQTYEYGAGPTPPQHPNCRSITEAVIDWKGLGLPEPPDSTRSSTDGQTSAQTYQSWLEGKSAGEQDRILGPGRGKAFRKGVSLRDMVRGDGTSLTLSEIEGKIG